jgi:hypothetical protein
VTTLVTMMSAGSCWPWSSTSRATRGPRWSTSCRGDDVAFEDDAGRHDTTLTTPVVTLQASNIQRRKVGSTSETWSESSRGGRTFGNFCQKCRRHADVVRLRARSVTALVGVTLDITVVRRPSPAPVGVTNQRAIEVTL